MDLVEVESGILHMVIWLFFPQDCFIFFVLERRKMVRLVLRIARASTAELRMI